MPPTGNTSLIYHFTPMVDNAIDDFMTPEEKDKLFTAIGYSESTLQLNYPSRLEAKLEHWYVTGLRQQDIVPSLVASVGDTTSSLLEIEFETNPENSTADQTLVVQSQPVEVIYDALNSKDQRLQKTTNSSLEEIMDKAYDKFDVEIKNVQLLFARAASINYAYIATLDIHVELAKAMIEKDVRTARFKVSGGLPLMHVRISDQKMKDALCLINSIPLPQKSSELFPERQVSSIPVISHRTKGLLGTSLARWSGIRV
ncbi:hypothetical protein MC885_011202 [Smutsia gigantea]|nr:hypothetical protein MC885_011202 [Smutsia gigantea]